MCLSVSSLYAGTPVYKQTVTQSPVAFFAGNQDIPVMPGLVELEARSFSYDKPEGEITEIVARMDGVSAEEVLYYYEVTLSQFGWGKVNKVFDGASFYREKVYLDISFVKEGADELVRIMIRPVR
jgi:hypothetical protein